ncbi:acylneuraminate cytidylyltransferase family protein [Butyricicoccus sp. 1XD8-22]|nr:acylneuraminate cytidylyltransferase family protein [Butyricicoccus sp. 1XD8-22]
MKKKVVAFVPIKLNSQRLPYKNILPFGDHPLCWHIFNNLLKVKEIDDVYVFCSDEKIKNYIPSGIKFLKRSKSLDEDLVKGEEIYKAFINKIQSDVYILAHTTSPFLTSQSIENSLKEILYNGYDSALSVKRIQTFVWYDQQPLNYELDNVPRTQDIKPIYVETSGFFMFEKSVFTIHGRRIGFKPYFQSVDDVEAIDIDTKEDYNFALKLISAQ